jgi:hypothetical protein
MKNQTRDNYPFFGNDNKGSTDQGQLPDSLVMTTRGAIGASAPLWLAMQIPSVNFKFRRVFVRLASTLAMSKHMIIAHNSGTRSND